MTNFANSHHVILHERVGLPVSFGAGGQMTDEKLRITAAIVNGGGEALNQCLRGIAEVVARKWSCGADVDDLTQHLWLYLWERRSKLKPDRSPWSYSYKMATREAAAWRRKASRAIQGTTDDLGTCTPIPQPLTTPNSPPRKMATARYAIRSALAGAIKAAQGHETGSDEYGFSAAGVRWLQEVYRNVTGKYRPCTLPTMTYTTDRVTQVKVAA